jgi:hypothetical protein
LAIIALRLASIFSRMASIVVRIASIFVSIRSLSAVYRPSFREAVPLVWPIKLLIIYLS